jgi:hypothetical protein
MFPSAAFIIVDYLAERHLIINSVIKRKLKKLSIITQGLNKLSKFLTFLRATR